MTDLADIGHQGVVPRSQVGIGIESSLRGDLAGLARGRVLVIDYFASRRCSVVVGDLTAQFTKRSPGSGYTELAAIEGVRLFTDLRLLPVLRDGEPTLVIGGPPFARHLAVRLERPERWLDFLDEPGILAGKQAFRRARS